MPQVLATQLPRTFEFTDKGKNIELEDINPLWTPQQIRDFHSTTYPILTTANISTGTIDNDRIRFKFETTLGTKG